jgi:hypothetical protein
MCEELMSKSIIMIKAASANTIKKSSDIKCLLNGQMP